MRMSLADRPIRRRGGGIRVERRHVAAAMVVAMIGVSMSVPAHAEGSFESRLSAVRTGFETRHWTDRGSDGVATTTRVSGCSRSDAADFKLDVELIRYRSIMPNVSQGIRNVSSCKGGTAEVNWGNPGDGEFFDQFWHQEYGTVSADSVDIIY